MNHRNFYHHHHQNKHYRVQQQPLPLVQKHRAKSVPNLDIDEVPHYITDNRTGVTYTIRELLGRGGFAKCFLASSNRQNFALKVISRESIKQHNKQIYREILIHYNLRHPNIVTLYSTFECLQNIYMLMELCPNRTLAEHIEFAQGHCLPESTAIVYMKQLLLAVRYLHDECALLHRDIKPANVLFSQEWNVKLADFGFCCPIHEMSNRLVHSICGTPNYVAAEVIDKLGHTTHTDCWSLACTYYTMLFSRPPFHTGCTALTYERIRRCQYNIPPHHHNPVSEASKDLIRRTLVQRPEQRLSCAQMLRHQAMNPRPSFDWSSSLGSSGRHSQHSVTIQFDGKSLHRHSPPVPLPSPIPFIDQQPQQLPQQHQQHLYGNPDFTIGVGNTTTTGGSSTTKGLFAKDEIMQGNGGGRQQQADLLLTMSNSPSRSRTDRTHSHLQQQQHPQPPLIYNNGNGNNNTFDLLMANSVPTLETAMAATNNIHEQSNLTAKLLQQRPWKLQTSNYGANIGAETPAFTTNTSVDTTFGTNAAENGTVVAAGQLSTIGGAGDSGLGAGSGSGAEQLLATNAAGPLARLMQYQLDKYIEVLHAVMDPFNPLELIPLDNNSGGAFSALPGSVIAKWVDYTNKFGFGVSLRDGTRSMLFTDQSSLASTYSQRHFSYRAEKFSANSLDWSYREGFPNADLCTKVTILQCMRDYMDRELCPSVPLSISTHTFPNQQQQQQLAAAHFPVNGQQQMQQPNYFRHLFGSSGSTSLSPLCNGTAKNHNSSIRSNGTAGFASSTPDSHHHRSAGPQYAGVTPATAAAAVSSLVHIVDFRKFPDALFMLLSDGTCQVNFSGSHHKLVMCATQNIHDATQQLPGNGHSFQLHSITTTNNNATAESAAHHGNEAEDNKNIGSDVGVYSFRVANISNANNYFDEHAVNAHGNANGGMYHQHYYSRRRNPLSKNGWSLLRAFRRVLQSYQCHQQNNNIANNDNKRNFQQQDIFGATKQNDQLAATGQSRVLQRPVTPQRIRTQPVFSTYC